MFKLVITLMISSVAVWNEDNIVYLCCLNLKNARMLFKDIHCVAENDLEIEIIVEIFRFF